MSLRKVLPLLCVLLLAVGGSQPAQGETFSFAAIGNMPYSVPADFPRFQRLIKRINKVAPAFTLHVGDFKSGNTACTNQYYELVLRLFNTFQAPLIYTPGDNDWTDCHSADDGGMDPIERLAQVRRVFFANPAASLGRERMTLVYQPDTIENRRWVRAGVVFATLHIVGSHNNLQRNRDAVDEYTARNIANLAWMRMTFEEAERHKARAVVLAFQADMGAELDESDDRRTGFTDSLAQLRLLAQKFGKPVLLVHGDRYRFTVDKPVRTGRRLVPNITRLMVFGGADVHGVLVTVDTDNPDVFSFRTLMVPENMLPAEEP